jgi:hypothetical protein
MVGRTVMRQGDCVDVAQWLVVTWPSHGLPRGSGKMPNDNPRTNFQKIYIYKRFGGSAKFGTQQNSRTIAKFVRTNKFKYICVCVLQPTSQKGRPAGLTPRPPPLYTT